MPFRSLFGNSSQELSSDRGAWVAQLFEHQMLDFGLGHDLRVVRLSPLSGPPERGACLRFSPSPSVPFSPLTHSHSLSLSKKDTFRQNYSSEVAYFEMARLKQTFICDYLLILEPPKIGLDVFPLYMKTLDIYT